MRHDEQRLQEQVDELGLGGSANENTGQRPRSNPSSKRTLALKESLLATPHSLCGDRSLLLTASYRETEGMHSAMRQALAFDKVLSEMPIWIHAGELIVGNIASRRNGSFLFPEYCFEWLEADLDTISTRDDDPYELSDQDRAQIKESMEYWRGRTCDHLTRMRYSEEAARGEALGINPSIASVSGVGHLIPDIESVIATGLKGIIEKAESQLEQLDELTPENFEKRHFLKSVIVADKAVIKWARRFAALAREQATETSDVDRKAELEEIAAVCERVPEHPARNLREALQSIAFIMQSIQIESNGASISVGRLDQICQPFYERDVAQGILTKAEAVELLECLWLKFAEMSFVFPTIAAHYTGGYQLWVAITVAGQTAQGDDATNPFSYLILEATGNMRLPKPSVCVRVHKRTPEDFLLYSLEINKIFEGGQPAYFNDESIIASKLAFERGVTKEDAYNWSVVGCAETGFAGMGTVGLPSGVIDGALLLEHTMYGKDPQTGVELSPGIGDMTQWRSFDDAMHSYMENMRHCVRIVVAQTYAAQSVHINFFPTPFLSSLTRDCIDRGLNFHNGGARYGGGSAMFPLVGTANVANSLAAIKKLVFEEERLSLQQLRLALETNFQDRSTVPTGPEIRQLCLAAPKYGNDDPYVDRIAKQCSNAILNELHKYQTLTGGHCGGQSNPASAHLPLGMARGATPDGRLANQAVADSVSPMPGTEKSGPTAAAKSVAALDHVNFDVGCVFNMTINPASVTTPAGMGKWANLVHSFFDLGGNEIQFNMMTADTLRDAQAHPDKYPHLVVRVVGYSAYFNDLSLDLQNDIISRTEYMVG